jgi:hypothetical protein
MKFVLGERFPRVSACRCDLTRSTRKRSFEETYSLKQLMHSIDMRVASKYFDTSRDHAVLQVLVRYMAVLKRAPVRVL